MTRLFLIAAVAAAAVACDDGKAVQVYQGGCTEGCAVIAVNVCSANAIQRHANDLFWSNCDGITDVSLSSTVTRQITPNGGQQLGAFVLDDTFAYAIAPTASSVSAVPLAGGEVIVYANAASNPAEIVVSGGAVFWTEQGAAPDYIGSVMTASLDGKSTKALATAQKHPIGIAASNGTIYWVNSGDGSIMKATADGGTPAAIATGEHAPTGIAVDATNVYWTNTGDGTVRKAPIAGGAPTSIATGELAPLGIAVDAKNVYWTHTGGISRATVAGGPATILAPDQVSPLHVISDGTTVYWTDPGKGPSDGRIVSIPVP